jgi:uncharacterized protein DUF5719
MSRWGLVALACASALVAAGIRDAAGPPGPRTPRVTLVRAAGGSWACPLASFGSGGDYVYVANAGSRSSSARVVLVPDKGRPAVLPLSLPPGVIRAVAVQRRTKLPVGAIVEYTGGDVVAFHALAPGGPLFGNGTMASACGRAGATRVALSGARTLGTDTLLGLLNPGSSDAVVSIRLLTDDGVLQPERLSRRVVPARRRLIVRLADFAFDKRDFTAIVDMISGRVVAEGVVTGGSPIMSPASSPAARVVVPVGASGDGTLSMTVTGEDDIVLSSRRLGLRAQGSARGVPSTLSGLDPRAVTIPDAGGRAPVAYKLEARAGSGLVAAARWVVRRGETAELADATAAPPGRRWAGVLPAFSGTAAVRVLVANPGRFAARIRLRVLTIAGARSMSPISVAGNRMASVVLGRRSGVYGFEANSSAPVVMALTSVGGSSFVQAFAATAVPLRPVGGAAVTFDPRLGVPAPLSSSLS